MRKIFLILCLNISLFAKFEAIKADKLVELQAKGVPVIDIRMPLEWQQTGIIKGAYKIMFFDSKGQADVANWFFNLGHLIYDKNKPFIIYCAHANRTKVLGNALEQLGFTNIYELDGGIVNGWLKFNKPTVK